MEALLTITTLTFLRLIVPFGLILLLGTLLNKYDGKLVARRPAGAD